MGHGGRLWTRPQYSGAVPSHTWGGEGGGVGNGDQKMYIRKRRGTGDAEELKGKTCVCGVHID